MMAKAITIRITVRKISANKTLPTMGKEKEFISSTGIWTQRC